MNFRFGPLGHQFLPPVDLGGQASHLHALLHQFPAGRQRQRRAGGLLFRQRQAALALGHGGQHPLPRIRRGRRRLRGQRLGRDAGLRPGHLGHLVLPRTLRPVLVAAAAVAGLGDEIGLLGRFRGRGLGQDHVQGRHHGRRVLLAEADAKDQHAERDQRERQGGAQALGWTDLARGDGCLGGGRWPGRGDGGAHVNACSLAGPRSRRTGCRRCSARTTGPVRGRRSGW